MSQIPSTWPPVWLEQLYCRFAGKVNRFASLVVVAVMLVLIMGIAMALFTSPAPLETP